MPKYNIDAIVGREDITDLFGEKKAKDFKFDEELKKRGGKYIVAVDVNRLVPNPNNHFHELTGEQWDEFLSSVKTLGVINPIIVRPTGAVYEIIAGHNRVRAAREAGLATVPTIITEVDDVEASVLVGVSNKQRENTTDQEWGWAYRITYEAIARQGARTDLTSSQRETRLDDTTSSQRETRLDDDTSSQRETKLRSDEIVAEKYGVSRATIQRKMRLTYLVPQLYALYESKKLTQDIILELSYLTKTEQLNVAGFIAEGYKVDLELAKKFREMSGGEIEIDAMFKIFKEEAEQKLNKVRPRRYVVDDILFPEDLKKGERDGYIAKALQYIRDNEIKL